MNKKERIFKIISDNINCKALEVKDNSHLHKGHVAVNGDIETHYEVVIKANKFDNLSRVDSHKVINKLLRDEFSKGLHALEIKILH
jgi:BolA family transcriptional regulator, general stress-responsive regulator